MRLSTMRTDDAAAIGGCNSNRSFERPPQLILKKHDDGAASTASPPQDGILFVGTGVSSALPHLEHVLSSTEHCPTCQDAADNPLSKNRRNNVSLLIQHRGKNVLIDVGKTFRDAAIRVLRPNKINKIDALLLTHCHADAVMGIDDVRDLLHYERPVGSDGKKRYLPLEKLPTYLSQKTLDSLSRQFYYIIKASQAKEPLERKVTVLDFHIINDDPSVLPPSSFTVKNTSLTVTALPVWHGKPYVCLGFMWSFDSGDRVVYLSDVSEVPPEVDEFIFSCGPPIKVLIIDAIHWEKQHFSHMTLKEALELVRRYQPDQAYFVGMMCDIEHDDATQKLNEWLQNEKTSNPSFQTTRVALAYDGLRVPMPSSSPSLDGGSHHQQQQQVTLPSSALSGGESAVDSDDGPPRGWGTAAGGGGGVGGELKPSPKETPDNTPLPPALREGREQRLV